jgi:hypothetical protein
MLHTPKEIADFLVKRYGTSPKGIVIHRGEFERQAERYGVDHNLVRSIDLELRSMGYILFDLLKERECVVMMNISTVMEALTEGDVKRAG